MKGKSCPGFGPIGPWLVTKDEISDPQNLNMWLDLNGERKQNGYTSTMIHKVFFIVSYLSQFMLLSPGTFISTGTPSGVASSTGRFFIISWAHHNHVPINYVGKVFWFWLTISCMGIS